MVKEIKDKNEKMRIANTILRDIPEWFGIEEATLEYVNESKNMPFLVKVMDDKEVAFLALKETSPDTAEIYVMGCLKKYHNLGYGRELYNAFEKLAREMGYTYLQVKTVQMGRYEIYDNTNKFYIAMGFKELECFNDMWDPNNPCQIYIKFIGENK